MQWIQRFFRVAMNVGEPLPGKCFTVWFAACMRVLISLKCVGGDRIPQSFMLISLFANNRHVCFGVSNLLPINLKDIAVPLYSSSANYLRRYPSFSSNLFISAPYSHRPLPIRSQKLCQSDICITLYGRTWHYTVSVLLLKAELFYRLSTTLSPSSAVKRSHLVTCHTSALPPSAVRGAWNASDSPIRARNIKSFIVMGASY